MHLATITGFIKTLLWVAIGWFLLKTIGRLFKFSATSSPGNSHDRAGRQKGEVSIDRNTPPKKGAIDNNAEFVDFEEIKDQNSAS